MWLFPLVSHIPSQAVQLALRVLVVVVPMAGKDRVGMGMVLRERRRDWVDLTFFQGCTIALFLKL